MAKILHISKFYYPYFGGIEDVARTLVKELAERHEQRILCFNDSSETVEEVVDDIPVTRVGIVGTLMSQPIAIHFQKHLKRILGVFQPEYIHIHLPNPLSAFLLQMIGCDDYKIVLHWHSDILGQRLIYPFYRRWERRLLQKAYRVFVTSEAYKNFSLPLRDFQDKTVVLPNIVSEKKMMVQPGDEQVIENIRQQWGNKKIVFFVGRHVEYKGLRYLVEIEKQMTSDCVVLVAGDGPQSSIIRNLASGSSRIHFLGRLSNDELRCYLRAASVFVFPSYLRSEAFGVALAEALYCGLPAISYDIEGSGVNWVNRNGETGFVLPNLDIKGFAQAVDRVVEDDELRQRLSEGATAWIRSQFLKENMQMPIKEVYGLGDENRLHPVTGRLNVSVVLYRNSFEEVETVVKTLRKSPIVNDILLIDNSPEADSRYQILPVFYTHYATNLGYGRGHNEAFYRTFSQNVPYHLAINADVAFHPEDLARLVEEMDRDATIGALMPKVYYPNGKLQHLCRLLPTPLDLFGRRFLPACWMSKRVSRLELRHTNYDREMPIPHISGCFMLLRADALRNVGLFDPRYFLYMEDVDLSRRIHQKYRTLFYPSVTIVHQHERGSYKTWHLLGVHVMSAIRYFNKWGWWKDEERESVNQKVLNVSYEQSENK